MNACLFLSGDYKHSDWTRIPRTFPTHRRFQIGKIILGVGFVASFIATMEPGAAQHLGLVAMSLTILVLFTIVSFWESVKAFRHFAADNLTPRGKGGYRDR